MSDIIIYPAPDGKTAVQPRVQDGSVWLTQMEIAELFQTSKQNVSQHIRKVMAEKELPKDPVVKESFTTAADGKRWLSGLCRPERPPDSSPGQRPGYNIFKNISALKGRNPQP